MKLLLPLVLLSACSLQAQLGGKSTGPSSSSSSSSSSSGQVTIPEVRFMARADALAALKKAGVTGTIDEKQQLCGSVVDGRIVEKGQVCQQFPPAGRVQGGRLPVSIVVQPEDPRHGHIGELIEWHLMPDVTGMAPDRAMVALKAAGFTRMDRITEQRVNECAPNVVCRTYPEKLHRAGQNDGKIVYVGIDPNAEPKKQPVTDTPENGGDADKDANGEAEKKPEDDPKDFF